MNNTIKLSNKRYVTIAGQTAASRGVTLRCSFPRSVIDNQSGDCFQIQGSEHIILRYIRFRGSYIDNEAPARNLLDIAHSTSILLDHLSFAFASNNALDLYSVVNFTLQNSILAEVCTFCFRLFFKKKKII